MKYNGNKFSVYESEEKTVLGLLDELGSQVNHNTDNLKNKTDINGDHKGSWQGLSRPTLSDEGMRATVEKHMQDISNLQDKDILIDEEINKLKESDTVTGLEIEDINKKLSAIAPTNIIYMDSYGELEDYSPILQELVNSGNNVEIRFSNKDYVFNSKVTISKKIRLIGSNTSFIWKGVGRFLEYVNAPWMIEGCVIKDIIFTGRGKDVGQDIMIYSEAPNTMMTIDNCQFYNCYCFLRFHTQSFGHTIKDCSFWGFTTAIDCSGNAEQITIDHCWLDDGVRTNESRNPAIRVKDASSFWIVRTVIQNADVGVVFMGVKNGTIRDCHFENMINSSIWFNPDSMYDNVNCVVDCNLLCGGKRCIYFIKSAHSNVHITISNNYFAFLGDGATEMIQGNVEGACQYSAFYNNSIAPGFTDRKLMSSTAITNKMMNFQ